jgi:hypothetical protein
MANLSAKRQKKAFVGGTKKTRKYYVGAQVAYQSALNAANAFFRLDLAQKIIVFPNPAGYTESPLHGFVGKNAG